MDQDLTDPRTLTIGGTKDSRTSLKVVDHKFVIGKEEYYPFIAEMHYYRIPKRYWSVCFERIRKAEFRIISTSVPWNLHEARQGDFDFSGASDQAKDLVVFLELCREPSLQILLRADDDLSVRPDSSFGAAVEEILGPGSLVRRVRSGPAH